MKIARLTPPVLLLALATVGAAQTWSRAYEDGLASARKGQWSDARASFKRASANRQGDVSAATALPGPPTERRVWRDGSPYSPNFLAAYALYRSSGSGASDSIKAAAAEFKALIEKGQTSREAYYFLNQAYGFLGDTSAQSALATQLSAKNKLTWRVDTEVVAPEDLAAIYGSSPVPGSSSPAAGPTVKAGDPVPVNSSPILGRVPALPTKFALVIGNSEGSAGTVLPFAAGDAARVREALVTNAGYDPGNVLSLPNASAAQILSSAEELAKRVPEGGTVLVYFSGNGVNVDGRDYLAGIDSTSRGDVAHMVGKNDLFRLFMARGAHVFSFFQVDRPDDDGKFFGSEVSMVGAIAQSQATLPGDQVAATVVGGQPVGVYTNAFVEVLKDLRSNQIPVLEFGWQVFYKVRRGNTGTTGGASRQTPTLPVLTNLASDARF